MACNCGKRNPRPAWQPRGSRTRPADAANSSGNGSRIISPQEREAELANGRPARARQPGSR